MDNGLSFEDTLARYCYWKFTKCTLNYSTQEDASISRTKVSKVLQGSRTEIKGSFGLCLRLCWACTDFKLCSWVWIGYVLDWSDKKRTITTIDKFTFGTGFESYISRKNRKNNGPMGDRFFFNIGAILSWRNSPNGHPFSVLPRVSKWTNPNGLQPTAPPVYHMSANTPETVRDYFYWLNRQFIN